MRDMLKKINLDQIKEFLFNHGEKVGLGVCVFLALVFSSMGLLSAMNAGNDDKGKPIAKELKDKSDELNNGITRAASQPLTDAAKKELEDTEKRLNPDRYGWVPHEPTLPWHPMTGVSEGETSTKRDNPILLSINPNSTIQLEYIQAPVFLYDCDRNKARPSVMGLKDDKAAPGGGDALLPFVKEAKPYRMVVGTLVFPMKEQVAEFCNKLRMNSQKELFESRDDWPKPLGINVVRFELLPDGKWSDPLPLILNEPGKGLNVCKPLRELMRVAMFDENAAEKLEPYAFEGLMMPMPKLAHVKYKNLDLITVNDKGKKESEIVVDFDEPTKVVDPNKKKLQRGEKDLPPPGGGIKIGNPKKPPLKGKDEPPPQNVFKPENIAGDLLKSTNPLLVALAARLFEDDYNIYHILGLKAPDNQMKAPNPGVAPPGNQGNLNKYFSAFDTWEVDAKMPAPKPGVKPGAGDKVSFPGWKRDAVVRFIDPDVEPGKTYRYAVQVRMKNPNFNKPELVKFNALSIEEELKPHPLDPNKGWVTTDAIRIDTDYHLYCVDQQLLDYLKDPAKVKQPVYEAKKAQDYTTFQIHKWLTTHAHELKEYVVGDWAIAERQVVRKGDVIGNNVEVKFASWNKLKDAWEVPQTIPNQAKKEPSKLPGVIMDLRPPVGSILVDFVGGKRKDGKEEDSVVEALVLAPDGRLVVYNSGTDSESQNRKGRITYTRKRLEEVADGN